MRHIIFRGMAILLVGCLPGDALCNTPNPVKALPSLKSLKNLRVSSAVSKNILQPSSSQVQQAISRTIAARLDHMPRQPEMEMPLLTATFQARADIEGRANSFSGTVFKIEDKEGKPEIYGVIAAHAIAGSETSRSLKKDFIADVYNGKEFVSIPAKIVQLGAPGFLDMALVKFRPEDEKLFTSLSISDNKPTWADMFQTQGFSLLNPVHFEHRVFMGDTPFAVRTNMPWPRDERPGLCGAAVLNNSNKLVGIHTGSSYAPHSEQDDFGFLTPARFLTNLVEAYHHQGIGKFPIQFNGQRIIELNVDEYITKIYFLGEDKKPKTMVEFPGKFSYRKFSDAMETFSHAYVVFLVDHVFWDQKGSYLLDFRYGFPEHVKTYLYDAKKRTTELIAPDINFR